MDAAMKSAVMKSECFCAPTPGNARNNHSINLLNMNRFQCKKLLTAAYEGDLEVKAGWIVKAK